MCVFLPNRLLRRMIGSVMSLVVLALCLYAPALASEGVASSPPASRQSQRKPTPLPYSKPVYNVAYFQADKYWEFTEIYTALKDAVNQNSHAALFAFPDTYYYSPGHELPAERYDTIAQAIMANPDIDMVVALGSVASMALFRQNNGLKPVISLDVANPVHLGLIDPQTQQPVAPNFFIDYVPDKWQKSIALLDTLQHVEKIGTLSSNTPDGKISSNIKDLKEVGRERGFEVVTYERLDIEESVPACKKGIETLIASGIDAMYIPAISCFDPERGDPALLYALLHAHKIKTYAKDGKIPVENGALIGISTLNYEVIGKFFASILLQHIVSDADSGGKILPFEPKIYLNQATARKLGITFSINLMTNVDGIYDDTLPPIKEWP